MALFGRTVTRALDRLGLGQPGDAPFPQPLRPMLATLGRAPFNDSRTDLPPRWVKPWLVVEVEYRTSDGLRHAALKAVRPDKDPREVREAPLASAGKK